MAMSSSATSVESCLCLLLTYLASSLSGIMMWYHQPTPHYLFVSAAEVGRNEEERMRNDAKAVAVGFLNNREDPHFTLHLHTSHA